MTTQIIKTEWKQREFDGKWMLLGQVYDYENTYQTETMKLVPTMWIILDVKDSLDETN